VPASSFHQFRHQLFNQVPATRERRISQYQMTGEFSIQNNVIASEITPKPQEDPNLPDGLTPVPLHYCSSTHSTPIGLSIGD